MLHGMSADAREYLDASRQRGDVYIAGKTEEHVPGGVSLGLMATDSDRTFVIVGPSRRRVGAIRVNLLPAVCVTEFRFHHLERRRVDQALPALLERAHDDGRRVVVRAPSEEMVAALNDRLWTYDDASFLPHGAAGDGDPMSQPIFLTAKVENPNAATMLVLLSGAEPSPGTTRSKRSFFCSTGATRKRSPRRAPDGSASKTKGRPLSYWREGDDGWERAR